MVVTNLTYSAGFNAVSNEQIGNDSLYFPTGGFSSASGGSGTTQATGARYVIDNDTLKMSVQGSENMPGIVGTATETIYLLKQ
jgi:hypothetical protein